MDADPSLLIVVIALAALGLNATRINNLNTKGKAEANTQEPLFATIVFRGSHRPLQPLRVPFQIGSGQVNFGCAEFAHPSVSYIVPPGAREINASAEWVNTNNVKGQVQQAIVAGTTVTALGTLTGFDRNWVGNCEGGGHGELVLKGSYIVDQPSAPEPITKFVRAIIEPRASKMFDLPAEADLSTDTCEITISSEHGQYGHALLSVHRQEGRTIGEIVSREGKINVQLTDGRLSLRAALHPDGSVLLTGLSST